MVGGAGNNQIQAGTGNDKIYGHASINGSGEDTFQSYNGSQWVLNLSAVSATDDTFFVRTSSASSSPTVATAVPRALRPGRLPPPP